MPNLMALTFLSTAIGSLQPIAPPHDSSNLAQLYAADQNVQQLDQQFERIYVPLPAKSSVEIPPSTQFNWKNPPNWGKPTAVTIKPYGSSFMFNGVRVYVEPVAFAPAQPANTTATHP